MYWKGLGEERCWCWSLLFFCKIGFYFSPVLRFDIKPFQLLFLSLQFSVFRRLRDEFLSGGPPGQTICSADHKSDQTIFLRQTNRSNILSDRPPDQTIFPRQSARPDRHLHLTSYQWASTFQSRDNQPLVRILRTSCNSGQVHSLWVGSREVNL